MDHFRSWPLLPNTLNVEDWLEGSQQGHPALETDHDGAQTTSVSKQHGVLVPSVFAP